jgi:hypothetical protein
MSFIFISTRTALLTTANTNRNNNNVSPYTFIEESTSFNIRFNNTVICVDRRSRFLVQRSMNASDDHGSHHHMNQQKIHQPWKS